MCIGENEKCRKIRVFTSERDVLSCCLHFAIDVRGGNHSQSSLAASSVTNVICLIPSVAQWWWWWCCRKNNWSVWKFIQVRMIYFSCQRAFFSHRCKRNESLCIAQCAAFLGARFLRTNSNGLCPHSCRPTIFSFPLQNFIYSRYRQIGIHSSK